MSTSSEVTQDDLHVLLGTFEKRSFAAASCEPGSVDEDITSKCESLFKKDYALVELDNSKGALCPCYPRRIFIPNRECGHTSSPTSMNNSHADTSNNIPQNSNDLLYDTTCSNDPSSATAITNKGLHANVTFSNSPSAMQQQNQQHQMKLQTSPSSNKSNSTIHEPRIQDVAKLKDIVMTARYARCRQRFVVPVILYRGKCVCRSSTISVNLEAYGRKAVDYAYDYINGTVTVDDENNENREDSLVNSDLNSSPFTYEEAIKCDIELLKTMNVNTIVDLMVEKKKNKFLFFVSSSEKADPDNHYGNFQILSLPYPGCEFFKKFRDNNYMPRNLHYDWSASFNDATISVPESRFKTELNINWDEYKSWDLVLITQNYLKTCLKYIQDEREGLLIHCISGWDRTPLFISLVRLSMWADGLIHQSLNALQITYLTLAYDWYLFGHQLPERLKKGEDILFFCFYVLKYLTEDEFSVVEHRRRTKTPSSSGSTGSFIILKSDSCDEEFKEDFICDQDSNESFSNSSFCDISITDNYYANTAAAPTSTATAQGPSNNVLSGNPLTNRSPNAKRSKTSPISVPGASVRRKRHESTSSTGSWSFVNDTGSIESTLNDSLLARYASHQQQLQQQQENSSGPSSSSCAVSSDNSNNCSNTPNNSSNNDASSSNAALNNLLNNATRTDDSSTSDKPPKTVRHQRLSAVRTIFMHTYGKSVGLRFKEGSPRTLLGTLF